MSADQATPRAASGDTSARDQPGSPVPGERDLLAAGETLYARRIASAPTSADRNSTSDSGGPSSRRPNRAHPPPVLPLTPTELSIPRPDLALPKPDLPPPTSRPRRSRRPHRRFPHSLRALTPPAPSPATSPSARSPRPHPRPRASKRRNRPASLLAGRSLRRSCARFQWPSDAPTEFTSS